MLRENDTDETVDFSKFIICSVRFGEDLDRERNFTIPKWGDGENL